jgi:limonene-1,2-epoxide hydrolase
MTAAATVRERIGGLFAAIDAKDTDSFLGYVTEDASFRFGSMPAVHGHNAIRAAVDGFFSTIAGCRHEITNSVAGDGTLLCEGEVTYQRHDGSDVTLPFANVFEVDDDLIADYKIYIDIGPLYAQ